MSEEDIKITAIIRTDNRNPFSKIVFSPLLASQHETELLSQERFTKESIIRMFRNIRQGKFMRLAFPSKEIQLMHSLQGLFISKAAIDEIELIAESSPGFEDILQIAATKQFKHLTARTVAILKLPHTKIVTIIPINHSSGDPYYYLEISLSGGSTLVTY